MTSVGGLDFIVLFARLAVKLLLMSPLVCFATYLEYSIIFSLSLAGSGFASALAVPWLASVLSPICCLRRFALSNLSNTLSWNRSFSCGLSLLFLFQSPFPAAAMSIYMSKSFFWRMFCFRSCSTSLRATGSSWPTGSLDFSSAFLSVQNCTFFFVYMMLELALDIYEEQLCC